MNSIVPFFVASGVIFGATALPSVDMTDPENMEVTSKPNSLGGVSFTSEEESQTEPTFDYHFHYYFSPDSDVKPEHEEKKEDAFDQNDHQEKDPPNQSENSRADVQKVFKHTPAKHGSNLEVDDRPVRAVQLYLGSDSHLYWSPIAICVFNKQK